MSIIKQPVDVKRTAFAKYPESITLANYKNIAIDMLRYVFPLLTEAELAMAVDDSISKHFTDTNAQVNNNYKNRTIDMTLRAVADYICYKQPITTSYGVMFMRHGTVPNPLYNVIDSFISSRKVLKKEMFKYPKGTEMFEKYNLLQLLAKIDAKLYPLASLNPLNCWKLLRAQ
jgi:hypothetical protein